MRKNIVIIMLLVVGVGVSAQTEYDALRLSQQDIQGTARYMSLGGAMGALGGDASAIKDNPAGLGVYRSSELTATLNTAINSNSTINWLGEKTFQDAGAKLSFNNLTYVLAIPMYDKSRGLVGSNFSFSFNKLYDYNTSFFMKGKPTTLSFMNTMADYSTHGVPGDVTEIFPEDINYDNVYMPWLTVAAYNGYLINIHNKNEFSPYIGFGEQVTPSYSINQSGSANEFAFGWSGNFNNNLFVGANLNFRSVNYAMTSLLREDFLPNHFTLKNNFAQSGFGVGMRIGAIYLPTNNLRLGLAFHTPSLTHFTEESYADLESKLIPSGDKNPEETPINRQSFNLSTPLQAHFSAAYLFGKSAFISAEYNYINYRGARLSSTSQSVQVFGDVNRSMKDVVNDVHVLKVGAEYKFTPSLAIRAGYAMFTPGNNKEYAEGKRLVNNSVNTNTEYFDQKNNTNYLTLGLGYREAGWFIDFAYALRMQKMDFYPYQNLKLSSAVIDNKVHNIVLTFGLRM